MDLKLKIKFFKEEYPRPNSWSLLKRAETSFFSEMVQELTNKGFKTEKMKITEMFYIIENNITELKLCNFCSNPVRFIFNKDYGCGTGYNKFCSTICSNKGREKENFILEPLIKIDKKKISKYEYYSRRVSFFTDRAFKNFKYLINPENLPLGLKTNHVDHIYSKYEGFLNNIPPYIIGSEHNLQILPKLVNETKGAQCWITKEELFEKFFKSQ